MNGHHIRLAEELVLRDEGRPGSLGDRGCHVLAPGDDGHAESPPDARDLAADIAEAEHTQHPALELSPNGRLPAARADRMALPDDLACAGQNERPGHLDGRGRSIAGCGDADPALFGGLYINGRVARPG